MKGALLVAGTASDAGKSVVVAGICRWLVRRGVSVAPFKAQNMALNSAVTPDGAEIGRAQVAQAAACGVVPEAAMNPILLKPTGDSHTQVIVMGHAVTDVDARSFQDLKPKLIPVVLDALASLRSRFDVVVCEGAGSPSEINLRANDLVNMGLARAAGLPVILVGDIDRGGVFASLFGTLALLDRDDQALIAGFVINKFRGDLSVLQPGIAELSQLTGRKCFGVLPWVKGLWLDVEDSLALESPRDGWLPPRGPDALSISVIRLRWMSNFTDFDALAAEPGVTVRFTQSPADVASSDLVIIPGTKATVDDLAWLRSRGLDDALVDRVRKGLPTLGICGGYQMLGERIVDHVESRAGEVRGLGILPVETNFVERKTLACRTGWSPAFGATLVSGYEIRHGQIRRQGGDPVFHAAEAEEGCMIGEVGGFSWHGAFESDAFRRELLLWVASIRGLEWVPGDQPFEVVRQRRIDAMGDLIEEHVDEDALLGVIEGRCTTDLPFIDAVGSR